MKKDIIMEKKEKYTVPEAELIKFDFKEQVVASGETKRECTSYKVWDGNYATGRCWPLYSR